MDFLKYVQYFGAVFASLVMATAGNRPIQDQLRWVSVNFKTLLTWGPDAEQHAYNVEYAEYDGDWLTPNNCLSIQETECDLTNDLNPTKTYCARVKKESTDWMDGHSEYFTPYAQSEITAVSFTLGDPQADGNVTLNITDPLTSLHRGQDQLSIRDVFQKDLMYNISYQKAGKTRKNYVVHQSNVAVVTKLDPQEGYCFCVAAFIPSRPQGNQLGAWSKQQCTSPDRNVVQELSTGALVGGCLAILLLLLLLLIPSVLCYRRRRLRQQRRTAQTLPSD